MSASWQPTLSRWLSARLVDAATAERIRSWEAQHGEQVGRSRLAMIAFGLGGLLLVAGVLLFVAAHWDELSPASRFLLVLAMIGVFHVGGAFAISFAIDSYLVAIPFMVVAAGLHMVAFVRRSGPVTRKELVSFSVLVSSYVVMVALAATLHLIDGIVGIFEKLVDAAS